MRHAWLLVVTQLRFPWLAGWLATAAAAAAAGLWLSCEFDRGQDITFDTQLITNTTHLLHFLSPTPGVYKTNTPGESTTTCRTV